MNKYIFLLILIVFTGCSNKQEEVYVTKKVYPDVSKNAVFDAAKTLLVFQMKIMDKAFCY
jgi:hypothetical protein